MNIDITGNKLEVTSALHDLILNKFGKIQRHSDNITNVHVILSKQKLQHTAEATMHVPGEEIFAKSASDDMYKAIDDLVEKLDRQVKKHKEKVTDHHRGDHE